MPQHVMIVGGGVGGTIVANLLARHLHPYDAEITLIESTGKHVYMPAWLYMPFNHVDPDSDQVVRSERDLLSKHVQHVRGEVIGIDTQNRELHVKYSEGLDEIVGTGVAVKAIYAYDYLVLATGADKAFLDGACEHAGADGVPVPPPPDPAAAPKVTISVPVAS